MAQSPVPRSKELLLKVLWCVNLDYLPAYLVYLLGFRFLCSHWLYSFQPPYASFFALLMPILSFRVGPLDMLERNMQQQQLLSRF